MAKKCPFCGGVPEWRKHIYLTPKMRNIIPPKKRHLLRRFYVLCIRCGAQTSLYKTVDEAVEAWNRRTE